MLFIIARTSNTSCSIHRARISSTLSSALSLKPDVSILSPARAPAVSDNPVVSLSSISAITNKLDSVVQSNIRVKVTSIIDSTTVRSPSTSIDSNSKRSILSQVSHDSILVIGCKGVVTSDSNNWGSVHEVIHTVPSLCCGSRSVGVIFFCNMSEELDVCVAELRNRSHTATSSTTGERVGSAGCDLLRRQLWG